MVRAVRWYVKSHERFYLDVWGGPALPGEPSNPRWVGSRESATAFTQRHHAYAAAGKYPNSIVVRVRKP